MIAVAVIMVILLVVTAAGAWGVDSREPGDWSSNGVGPFDRERDFD